MNTRALYIALAVQAFFAGVLLVVGLRSRDDRKLEYLELTHRVASGHGLEADYTKLAAALGPRSDEQVVRALFGPPLRVSSRLHVGVDRSKLEPQVGNFWVYYIHQPPSPPVDPGGSRKLTGPAHCFVVEFEATGKNKAKTAWVQHPLEEQ